MICFVVFIIVINLRKVFMIWFLGVVVWWSFGGWIWFIVVFVGGDLDWVGCVWVMLFFLWVDLDVFFLKGDEIMFVVVYMVDVIVYRLFCEVCFLCCFLVFCCCCCRVFCFKYFCCKCFELFKELMFGGFWIVFLRKLRFLFLFL